MGAGKGGDGGGGEGAAAAEAAQPVVLKMVLHCAGCAKKVTKAIRRMPGVESVTTDTAKNIVIVAGTADANALKARLEAKTNKAVEVVSAGSSGGGPKKAAAVESKDAGAGEKKQAGKGDAAGEKSGDKDASPKEDAKEKKQLQAEEKPKEDTTVVLKIPLHCAGCADRIRRRIYKTKGVKDVVVEGNAKDEVQVTGTMDVPAMMSYLREKLKRPVEAVAPTKKDGGGGRGAGEGKDKSLAADENKDAGVAHKSKDVSALGDADKTNYKGKGIDASAGTSTVAAAAAFMAAPPTASTYHVTPPYAYAAYQQQGPPASASGYSYPYYGNADGMGYGYANPSSAATYYHPEPPQQLPQQYPDHQAAGGYQPYPYHMDMSPPTQLFSDENPNACSVM